MLAERLAQDKIKRHHAGHDFCCLRPIRPWTRRTCRVRDLRSPDKSFQCPKRPQKGPKGPPKKCKGVPYFGWAAALSLRETSGFSVAADSRVQRHQTERAPDGKKRRGRRGSTAGRAGSTLVVAFCASGGEESRKDAPKLQFSTRSRMQLHPCHTRTL